MYDNGEQTRMGILERDLKGRIAELLKRHSWEYAIERKENNGEYLLVKIEKNSIIKKFALIYSQSTDKKVYQQIENEADACLINSMSFDNDNFFTKDFSKPLMLASDLLSVLKEWNQEATQTFTTDSESHELFEGGSVHIPEVSHLMAENKSEQIWMMIKALKSVEICKKFISKRYSQKPEEYIVQKSVGVSFLIQNACEYFDNALFQNFTQRLLSLYYGTLALVEAELLATSEKYETLHDVENITKNGHGLYTTWSPDNGNPDNLLIGVLGKGKGLFPCFLENRGIDIKNVPTERDKKTNPDNYCFSFNSVLNRIPELATLMRLIDDKYQAGFFNIAYDAFSNHTGNMFLPSKGGYNSNISGTYVNLYDYSRCSNLDVIKLLHGPIEQQEVCKDEKGVQIYKIFVKHENKGNKTWWSFLNTHNSSFCNPSILVPLNGLGDDWETYSLMVLYTFSIIVRYYPNLWRQVQSGKWDKYLPAFQQFAMVVEKTLPGLFYERITGQKLHVQQSGIFG